MKAAVWNGEARLDIQEAEKPRAGRGEAVIRVVSAGVCATDIHVIHKRIAIGSHPTILGHEIAGTVAELGAGVQGWKPGERVVLDTAIGCGVCGDCLAGRGHLCAHGGEIGTAPYNGGFAEYVKAPVQLLHRLPEAISFDEGGILESMICPAGSIYRLGIRFGDSVLIQGAGPAGLAYVQTARMCGAGKIILSARQEARLALAKRYGADVVVNAGREDVERRVLEETGGRGVDVSIEAAGVRQTVELAVRLTARAGKVLFYGIPSRENCPPIDVQAITTRQLSLFGAVGNSSAWEPVIRMVAKGSLSLREMVTHTFPLEEINTAIDVMQNRKDGAIKAVVHP